MAVPGTLLLKAKALLISVNATAVPDDNVVYFLNGGARFAVNSLPLSLSELWTQQIGQLANGGQASNGDYGVKILDRTTNEAFTIVEVYRDGYIATKLDNAFRYTRQLSAGFMLPTKVFPKWYLDGNIVLTIPAGTDSEETQVDIIQIPAIISTTATFHYGLENAVIYYAVSLGIRANTDYSLMNLANTITTLIDAIDTEMPNISAGDKTLITTALSNAEKFMVSGSIVTSQKSAGTYVVEEDSEMVEANVASARGEIERALALIKSLVDQNSVYAQKINSVASALASASQSLEAIYQSATYYMQQAMAEVQGYIINNSPQQPVVEKPQEQENKQ